MALMDSIFGQGFQTQFNPAQWAQMPIAGVQPAQGVPTPVSPMTPVAPQITGAADYNTMLPTAGGTPAPVAGVPGVPPVAGAPQHKYKGLMGALYNNAILKHQSHI